MDMIVKAENIVKRYGELIALDHFNLEIHEGEIFGLLGPNGSGKTTAIQCLLSLLKYDKGTVELFGKRMSPDAYDIKRDIGIILQDVAVFKELTVYENIDYFCGLYINDKAKRKVLVDEAIAFAGLNEFTKFYPKKLSGGLLRRLNIACGIAHRPKLIIMDEPTVAVDPQSRNSILEGIIKLNQEGSTIIYTSHYMEEVEQICTRIMIMDKGKSIAIGTKDELKGMINVSEKITLELYNAEQGIAQEIRQMKSIAEAEYKDGMLHIRSAKGTDNVMKVLAYMNENGIRVGKIYAEPPTLNDVFLEITGKALRD